MNTPIRTAVLGGRLSNAWSPLATGGASGPLSMTGYQHQPCRRSAPQSSPLKQHPIRASSYATACKSPMHPANSFSNTCRGNYSSSSANSPTLQLITRNSQPCLVSRRNSSTSTQAASSSSHPTSTSNTPVKLDWNTFFQLRASRRKYSLISSVLAAFTTTAAGGQILATQNLESLGAQIMGFDPLIVLGLATAASGALGWLAGPFLGNGLWGLVYRKYKSAVAIKEKEFYDRIKRFRVDPSANSFANPVPDYYGEKIGSVQGYRQWLKDQRAYNRKKRRFV
ncbi:presequence translocase-associated motor subunit Pam17, putative [Trichophyton verrucosum HKI 0517]|uniref:Presequence translocated-associated motor subunit PAM17 n=1 Tax=Trichophyton verrucosum (strain HKI 0517) TaxID=663202 RepID=D4DKK9_TRIVH|nr:presequence translocase-associated motor subunit Pam17, putative [Trichophyton verrucosum HKI 0517]EFE37636.1 presequence translocase-associated motor subunit Pam17, putative [Trichophyton verrucosum HKI 0517]